MTARGRHLRTRAGLACAIITLPTAVALGACSTESVSGDCDAVGVEHEIDHMVSEAGLRIESLDDIVCAGTWAYARATVVGAGAGSSTDDYLFQRDSGMWILRDPMSACGTVVSAQPPLDATVPADLFPRVCLEDAGLLPEPSAE